MDYLDELIETISHKMSLHCITLGLLCVVLFSGCAGKQPATDRTTCSESALMTQLVQRPIEHKAPRPSLLDIPLRKQTAHELIPDRLLVQIAPSEIADSFRRETKGCFLEKFEELGLLPADLGVDQIRYRGLTRDGRPTFSLRMSREMEETAVRRAFRDTKLIVLEVMSSGFSGALTKFILVAIDADVIADHWAGLCAPELFYFKKTSYLKRVLREIGTVSVRRVFRALEQPHKTRRGFFTIRSFKDTLEAAKKANKQRTARAYTGPDLNKERPTRRNSDSERIPFSVEGMGIEKFARKGRVDPGRSFTYGAAAKLAGLLGEKEIRIPDNMENWFVITLRPGVDLRHALLRLKRLSIVQRASADVPFKTAQVDDPEWDDQWGLYNTGTFQGSSGGLAGFDIGIEEAWAVTSTGEPVIVAVIDTGINENLVEFSYRLWTNPGETENNEDTDCNGYVDDVHGITTYDRFAIDYSSSNECSVSPGGPAIAFEPHASSVAGVIAAATNNGTAIAGTAGIDPVELMNIALGSFGDHPWPPGWSEFAEAMFYAISPKPDGSVRGADIVNMSLITHYCGYLGFASIYAALDAGLILVGAAGNDAVRFDVDEEGVLGVFPASVPGVITVGGSSRDGRWWDSSNYGPGLDIVAPADEVRTLSYNADNPEQTNADIITSGGTSLGAAFVSGTAAVILGRFPDVTAPFMRQWLRAKATDILDPLGDGSSHVGVDEWTGAGMLNAGDSTTALATIHDQPIIVAFDLERSKDRGNRIGWFLPKRPLAVGGQPDLGIRVQGSSLDNWSLSYGVGDAPTNWIDLPVSPSTLMQQEMDYAWVAGEIDPLGLNFLDTDALVNQQVYTVRLEAENRAGSKFVSDNYFIPTRAEILFPPANATLVPEWGWLPVGGFVDTRPSSNFRIETYNDSNQPVWQTDLLQFTYADTPTEARAMLSNFGHFGAWSFPASTSVLSEGWHEYRLTVNSSAGTDLDSARFYADVSHFSAERWDLMHEPIEYETSYGTENLADFPLHLHNRQTDVLLVSNTADVTAPRLFLQAGKSVMALDRDGALVWEKRPYSGFPFDFSFLFSWNMAVSDVNGDGSREVLYAVNELDRTDHQHWLRVFLLSADSGMSYNGNWPKVFYRKERSPGYIAAADILGNGNKEIILAEPRYFYYGIPEDDLRPATLRVFDLDGNELWSREFPIEINSIGPLKAADIDNDGKEEILITNTGQILSGNNTFLAGWSMEGSNIIRAVVKIGSGTEVDVIVQQNGLTTLKAPDGTVPNGWPVEASGPLGVTQIVPGGAEEIIVCGNTIQTFDITGARVSAVADITVDGVCSNIMATDVDGDGTDELLALVHRYADEPAPNERQGSFIEAYRIDGERLADNDNRWPVVVAPQSFFGRFYAPVMNRQLAIGDVDGDNDSELVQILTNTPYGIDKPSLVPSARIEVLHLQ